MFFLPIIKTINNKMHYVSHMKHRNMFVNFDLNVVEEEKLQAEAEKIYGEREVNLVNDVNSLKSWIQQCPHLQNIRNDDECLKFFLRGCGHSLERTKKHIDAFFTVKTNLPEWYEDWDCQNIKVRGIEIKFLMWIANIAYDYIYCLSQK